MSDRATSANLSRFLKPGEVMDRLRVSRKTLIRYEADGVLRAIRLPSGHRRYSETDVEAIERGEASA